MEVGLALIGCGYWGKNYIRTVGEVENARLKTICDLKKKVPKIPKETVFTNDQEDILRDPEINGVIIATPSSSHYDIAIKFIDAGKNVMVEKPLTTDSEEARELCKAAESKGVLLMVGEVFRFHNGINYMGGLIGQGDIGDLRYIESRRVGLGPIRQDVSALWDLATHDIYISNMLVGKKPYGVNCQGISHNGSLDDISCLNLKYKDPDVLTTIYVNWEHPIKERKLIAGGTKKAILLDDVAVSEKIVIYDRGVDYQPSRGEYGDFIAATRDGDIVIPKLKINPPLEEEVRYFTSMIEKNDGSACRSSGQDGLDTVLVLEAAEKSRKNGGMEVLVR